MAAVPQTQTEQKQSSNNHILEVKGLKKYFPIQKGLMRRTVGYVKAVDDVNFFVREGETLGVRIYAQREDLFNAMHRV